MKLLFAVHLLLLGAGESFTPAVGGRRSQAGTSLALDPSGLNELPNHVQSLHDAFSSISLSDVSSLMDNMAASESLGSVQQSAAVQQTVDAVQQTAAAVGDAGVDAAEAGSTNGWFGFLTGPTESLLQVIHSVLVAVGVDSNAWGVSIIMMTLVIKLLTFPLTKTQLESTSKMQALQPKVKEIQAKYESNPEVMNQKISEIYQTNQVNPLAGCLPSLVQIPIFIGLYRAVLDLAKENKLDEPFLFLPNLEGPVYGADPTQGASWLFDNWVDGAPSLGWDDTKSFLILPVLLVVSQFVSMELMTPKDQPQQGNFILKLLPLMIGWFSLSVPAALCLYWMTNNIVTTATTLAVRNSLKAEPVAAGGAAVAPQMERAVFTPPPMREKPAGFAAPAPVDDVTPITAIDAEIIESEESGASESTEGGMGSAPPTQKKQRGNKKKKRRKN